MKKILIMGGNQFVGKEIVKNFLEKDYIVYVLNRGTRKNIEGVFFLKADRNNYIETENILKNIEVDIIVDVSAYTEEQVDILQKVMKDRFKQYILISSASVYNSIESAPVNEESEIGENLIWGDYAKNKYLAEQKTIENSNLYNFKYTIYRPFYIYGIGNNLDRENYFFSRIKYDLPIYIPSKNNIIQFGYVEDLALAIESSINNSDFYNQIFNISGDEYVTMSEFIEICAKVINKKTTIKYVDTAKSQIKVRDWFPFREVNLFGDISKLENTGFRNTYSLVQGLEKTYKYNDKNNLILKPVLHKIEIEN
ncbi:SDR family oxidoreductase [Fusobacterium hwasookii]|uniref:dTDP-glucose 4,6-dehydratase n=1 Tax=Fusobacterium hwasookii ChDC F128 TaxID=1216362 RepID=A0ABN0GZJ4_9FUSO|nr:SDR family oxidoreductase [Fusobacterium hwasookii]EJU07406.1 dTDP-glucose 4,6-dehydratase [Fusobacterium hwasookii ChDC F128]QNE65812.1 SDR family oxidoreductase [Fusobacterium hwasookii]